LEKFDPSRKNSQRAAEQDRPELKAQGQVWRADSAAIDPARSVFVDETGTNTAMARRYGRDPPGRDRRCLPFDGATNAATFKAYIEHALSLRPGDIVLLDNLATHRDDEVERLIRQAGAEPSSLSVYSPDVKQIEKMFDYIQPAGSRRTLRAAQSG
jgi:hypothetical protein